ncbi:HEPN domain-containing protein [Synechococcus elongatus]|uniref:ApeA N-terminal domain 1-containing protein n=1 Tax=Synechococcus elongatus TaxID=32046 RepID=UPI000F7E45F5|nr:HEPN domain-containing protein [Synechococcus elongatus]
MRIKEKFKKAGYFWLPSLSENKIPGTLTIVDGGEIELEILGLFDENIERFNDTNDLIKIIGCIEDHGPVTLEKCFFKKKGIPFDPISKSIICVNRAFVGIAYVDQKDILFNDFQFSVEGIDEWVGISGIKVVENRQDRETIISYTPPSEISLNLNNGMKLLITFHWSNPVLPSYKEAKIQQKIYFKLTSDQALPTNNFIYVAHKITTLLCFALDRTVCIDHVVLTSNEIQYDIGHGIMIPVSILLYYASIPYVSKELRSDRYSMLFRFEQIRDDAERIVNNWLDAYNEVDPALNLYFSMRTGAHKYLEGKFLALAQGLETYHRRTSNSTIMDESTFEELVKGIISQCPDDKKKWLSEKLKYGNEVNLRFRIKDIIEPFKEMLGSCQTRKRLIKDIVCTRNYLTHYNEDLKPEAVTGKELYYLCLKMEAIFQLHLLQILGFTKSEIQSVFDNSHELKQKLESSSGQSRQIDN